jgi:hypothetical protein
MIKFYVVSHTEKVLSIFLIKYECYYLFFNPLICIEAMGKSLMRNTDMSAPSSSSSASDDHK